MKTHPPMDCGMSSPATDMLEEPVILSVRLAEARRRSGITQSALGKLAGKSRNCISQYERGARKPDPVTLCAYARACGVSVDYLLGLSDDPSLPGSPLSPGHHAAASAFTLSMQDDSMSLSRVHKGDRLTLSPQQIPRAGDLVLTRRNNCDKIMLYLECGGSPLYCADTRSLRMIRHPDLQVLAVVTGAFFVPRVSGGGSA